MKLNVRPFFHKLVLSILAMSSVEESAALPLPSILGSFHLASAVPYIQIIKVGQISDSTYAGSRVATEYLGAIYYSQGGSPKLQSATHFSKQAGPTMKNLVTEGFPRTRQALARKAAAQARRGLRVAQNTANKTNGFLSTNIAARAREAASNAADSLLGRSKRKPAKALIIAAASAAALYAMVKALTPSRD